MADISFMFFLSMSFVKPILYKVKSHKSGVKSF